MDTVANTMTSLVNGQRVGKERVAVPYSKFTESILKLLQEKGIVAKVRMQESPRAKLVVSLAYDKDGKPAMTGVKRISKPGQRIYAPHNEMPYQYQGFGFVIVSTSKGMMDESQARKEKLGGELICAIW